MHVDLQLYDGPQPRHRHAGRDARRRTARRSCDDYTLYTAGTVDARDRRPAGRGRARARAAAVPAARRRGCGRSPRASTRPGSCSTRTCSARSRSPAGRRASPTAPAAASRGRTGASRSRRAARSARDVPPAGRRGARPGDVRAARRPCSRATGRVADASDERHRGGRPTAWSPRSCSGTSSASCARCALRRAGRAPAPIRRRGPARRSPHVVVHRRRTRRARPPPIPAELVPAARRHRHGRQRPVGERARAAADDGPRGGEAVAARRRRRARSRSASSTCPRTRSRRRTGRARRTRCGSSWASTATCIRRRRDQMNSLGRAGPLGRPPPAAVAVGHRRARDRRGADPRQRRAAP